MQGSTPSGASLGKGAIAPKPAGTKLSLPLTLTAIVVVGVVAALAAWMLAPRANEEPRQVSRFTITPSAPLSRLAGYDVNISPDGKRIVYFVETDKNGGIQLYVRELAELEARSVPAGATIESTAGNMNPFFSPDGRSLGVLLPGQGIVRINLEGGPPSRVLNEQGVFLGAVWTPDDIWVVSGGNAFYRVAARGGAMPERLEASTDDPSAPFRAGPTLLPGGNVMLFGLITGEKEDIAALDLRTRDEHIVLEAGSDPWYVAPGYLVFARATTVMGVRFDPRKLVTVGQPVALLQGVRHPDQNSAADFAVSENGTLVYIPDDGRNAGTGSVVWVERDGHVAGSAVTGVLEQPRDPRLSPDGRRLLLTTGSFADGDIWIYDLSGRPPLPLIVPGDNSAPVWSPDGSEVAFKGAGGIGFGGYDVRVLPADGSQTKPRSVHAGELGGAPIEWSAAGELFVYGGDHQDLAVASVEDGPVRELVPGPETKGHAALSRDGHWLAYESNRSGVVEIWAKRYPDGVAVRVSQGGGREPLCSRDGRELFYRQPDAMMAVPVDPSAGDFGAAKQLFEAPFYFTFDASVRTYDVAADGRFLMVQLTGSEGKPRSASIVVVQNWAEELKQRVGPAP
jgi:Tol biopolymer transport system component